MKGFPPVTLHCRMVSCVASTTLVLIAAMTWAAVGTPPPTHANLSYGPHERNQLDIWLAENADPTPLVIMIHGGGFRSGDKSSLAGAGIGPIDRFLAHGISVATINYRLTDGGENPYPIPMLDGARAVQFLRYHAERFHLNPDRFGATGGSAGGCMLMWIGFHDDLANPEHDDPVLRESSCLQALAPAGGQSSLHLPTLESWFGVASLVEHGGFRPLFGLPAEGDVEWTEGLLDLTWDASPISHLSQNDPPIYLTYAVPNLPVDEETSPNIWVHHPVFGIMLKKQMDRLGIECYVWYPGGPLVDEYATQEAFLIDKLATP